MHANCCKRNEGHKLLNHQHRDDCLMDEDDLIHAEITGETQGMFSKRTTKPLRKRRCVSGNQCNNLIKESNCIIFEGEGRSHERHEIRSNNSILRRH